jgi:hypothetical protein
VNRAIEVLTDLEPEAQREILFGALTRVLRVC